MRQKRQSIAEQKKRKAPAMVESDDEVFEFSRKRESGSESDCVVQSVIKLDRSLLIDLSSLRIGSMISEGRLSVVHEGLWVTFP